MPNSKILYLEATKRDFYNPFMQHNPNYHYRDADGKLDHIRRPHPDPPWFYTKTIPLQNCHFYHKVLFTILYQQQKVPVNCQKYCIKTVVAPRNLEEVVWTYLLQRQLDLASKVGSEVNRENSNKLWGAYWYSRTWEAGHERYKQIKAIYDRAEPQRGIILGCPVEVNLLGKEEAKELGFPEEVPIILKRACTEFEQHCGPSSKWTWDEEQEEKEKLALDAFVSDQQSFTQNDYQRGTLFSRWIHEAYRVGDESYKKFTNGNDLFAVCETYHDRPEWRPEFPDFTKLEPEKEVNGNGEERP